MTFYAIKENHIWSIIDRKVRDTSTNFSSAIFHHFSSKLYYMLRLLWDTENKFIGNENITRDHERFFYTEVLQSIIELTKSKMQMVTIHDHQCTKTCDESLKIELVAGKQ